MSTFTMSPYTFGSIAIALAMLLYYVYAHSALYMAVLDRWGWDAGNRFLRIESAFTDFMAGCAMVLVLLNCFETFG